MEIAEVVREGGRRWKKITQLHEARQAESQYNIRTSMHGGMLNLESIAEPNLEVTSQPRAMRLNIEVPM